MTYIFDELLDVILAVVLTIAAVSFLVIANPLVSQSNDALSSPSTVYSEAHQPINEVLWTGSQVQFTLRDIEELGIPIRVGGFEFKTKKDVNEYIHSIFPNQNYSIQTTVNSKGELSEIQFFIK